MSSDLEVVGDEKHGSKPGDDRIQCVVVTPEKTLFDEAVHFVALPLYDGELGVLPGRAPLIGRLGFRRAPNSDRRCRASIFRRRRLCAGA